MQHRGGEADERRQLDGSHARRHRAGRAAAAAAGVAPTVRELHAAHGAPAGIGVAPSRFAAASSGSRAGHSQVR